MSEPPIPPENVRIVRPDGTEIPCEVRYVGEFIADDGKLMYRWEMLSEYVPTIPTDKIKVAGLPPRTQLTIIFRENDAEAVDTDERDTTGEHLAQQHTHKNRGSL